MAEFHFFSYGRQFALVSEPVAELLFFALKKQQGRAFAFREPINVTILCAYMFFAARVPVEVSDPEIKT